MVLEQIKKSQEKCAAVEDLERTSLEVGLAAIKSPGHGDEMVRYFFPPPFSLY